MHIGLTVTATLVVILFTIFYVFLRRLRTYWSRRNVPTIAENVFYGIHKKVIHMKHTIGESYAEAYEENRDKRYYGTFLFGNPTLVVQDPEIVKHIFVKDFTNFNSHGFYVDTKHDPLSGHLFNLEGSKWKSMRSKLTVTFTSGKIKDMFDTLQTCVTRLYDVVSKEVEEKGYVTNLRDKVACLGTDVIASVAFGIEAKTLDNPEAEFREVGRQIFAPTVPQFLRQLVLLYSHWTAKVFGIRTTSSKPYNFVMNMVKDTVDYREKNNIQRNDFLNMLIQLKNKGFVEGDGNEGTNPNSGLKHITIEELAAQVYVFYFAGFETTSTLTTFTLYELAVNKHIQKKVQEECDRVLRENGGNVTYEGIQSMVYTDKVIHETLRFFPPIGILFRATLNECILPTTDVKLDKGTPIVIPLIGFHMDPKFFPDPYKFDPERFSEEQKESRPPFVYMPFGDGPRICIGKRFGLLQVKSVLLGLLSRFDFDLTEDTPVPLKLDPKSSVTAPTKLDFVVKKRASTVY